MPHVVDDHRGLVLAGTDPLQVQTREGVHQLVAPRLDQQVRRAEVLVFSPSSGHHQQKLSDCFGVESSVVEVGVVFGVVVQTVLGTVAAGLSQQLLVGQEHGEDDGEFFEEWEVHGVFADRGTEEDGAFSQAGVLQQHVESNCPAQTHPRQENIQVRVFALHSDHELLAGAHQLIERVHAASAGALGLSEVDEVVAGHDVAVGCEVTGQFTTGAGVAVEGVEEDDDGSGPDMFGGLPGMCHESGAVVVPILVKWVVGYLPSELHIQLFHAVYPLQLVLALAHRYAAEVLVVHPELVAVSFHGFAQHECHGFGKGGDEGEAVGAGGSEHYQQQSLLICCCQIKAS